MTKEGLTDSEVHQLWEVIHRLQDARTEPNKMNFEELEARKDGDQKGTGPEPKNRFRLRR